MGGGGGGGTPPIGVWGRNPGAKACLMHKLQKHCQFHAYEKIAGLAQMLRFHYM